MTKTDGNRLRKTKMVSPLLLDDEGDEYKPKRCFHATWWGHNPNEDIPGPEDITDAQLDKVVDIYSDKVYSQSGTTCHQASVSSEDHRSKNNTVQWITRDWGKGQATAAVKDKCTIVGNHYFGPIPGITVGMSWQYRTQVASTGCHRPPVAGIAGQSGVGCQSIILAGG